MPALITLGAAKVIDELVAGDANDPGDRIGLPAKRARLRTASTKACWASSSASSGSRPQRWNR